MCRTAAFAAEEPGILDKLPDQFGILKLRYPAEVVLTVTVLAASARSVISLPHVEPSLLIAL